jgi:hypothetical protein
MNEDYLWDKTGEPDPEIEQLERKLSSLRYKRPAQPLPLPANSRWLFRHSFSPALAIAATLVILVLAGGLWFALHRSNKDERKGIAAGKAPEVSQPPQTASGPPPPVGPVNPTGEKIAQKGDEQSTSSTPPRRIIRHATAGRQQIIAKAQRANNASRAEEIARGEEAKAKLIMALHIASDKLNAVQKKIQGNPGPIS